jgi:membrane associated rhomboid family serine protease
MLQQKISRLSFLIAFSIVGIMWLVHMINLTFRLDLYEYGIFPQRATGIVGIIAAPFIHSTNDWGHILNNSLPMLILTWMLFYHYRTIATRVFLLIYLLTGTGMWLLARESYHIGMSGVIYGLTSFLVFSGFFRKNMRVAAVSLVVIFLYGSTVWGIFPVEENISWEGHALGMFSGIIAAVLFKYQGPQPQKMRYEIEEELGIEPEVEYWKEEQEQGNQEAGAGGGVEPKKQEESESGQGIKVIYTYKPAAKSKPS